jgi:threonine/homoserine/homoserine lactone efflux protein
MLLNFILLHLLASCSPGPDSLLVLRSSLTFGVRSGLMVTLGILIGVSIQIVLCLSGLALLLETLPGALRLLALAGTLYLLWIALSMWRSAAEELNPSSLKEAPGIRMGLFTNLLNPKAFLYFVSLFSIGIPASMGLLEKGTLALALILAQGIAFSLIALVASRLQQSFTAPGRIALINKGFAIAFALLALGLALFALQWSA